MGPIHGCQRTQEVLMFRAIRSKRRPTTPIARLTAALPALPRPHKKRLLPVGAGAIVRAGLVAVLIATTAVIFRDKLASIASRGDGGEEHAPESEEQAPEAGGE
jgi:hypothetical protein